MASELDQLIFKTQEVLQPLVAKPKLVDKLLAKPPFRFLHDVFMAIIGSSGFAKGLYNDYESDSANIKEKQPKIDYLNKMIGLINLCEGQELSVKANKIVAGLEPENTNIFLQALAKAVMTHGSNTAALVQKVVATFPSVLPPSVASPAAVQPATAAEDLPSSKPTSEAATKPVEGNQSVAGAKQEPIRQTSSEDEKKIDMTNIKNESKDERTVEIEKKVREAPIAAESKASISLDERKITPPIAERKATPPSSDKPKEMNEPTQKSASLPQETAATKAAENASNMRPSSSNSKPIDAPQSAATYGIPQVSTCDGDIERTREWMGALIEKPKMVQKLLNKPPFRYIHDIVSEVITVTGFAKGLYDTQESDSANVTEKNAKISYLNKLIQCLSVFLKAEIEAKSAKIVAGLEPELTNKLLQLLVVAAKSGKSSDSAVKIVLGADSTPTESTPSVPTSGAAPAKTLKVEPNAEAKSEANHPTTTTDVLRAAPMPVESAQDRHESIMEANIPVAETKDDETANIEPQEKKIALRPTTSRRRPPKLRENVKENVMNVEGNAVAPKGIMKDSAIEDDNDDFILDGKSEAKTSSIRVVDDLQKHGKLVRDILQEDKKETKNDTVSDSKADDTGASKGIRLGKRKIVRQQTGGSSAKSSSITTNDVGNLCASIQKICQNANPLGKYVEYIYEDIELMSKELKYWSAQYKEKYDVYDEEKKLTEECIRPLELELLEIKEKIKEEQKKNQLY